MINSYIPLEEMKDDLKKLSKEDLEQAMKKVDEDFVYTKQKEMYEKLKTKLESIRVSGDKGELWNFEASFLLGALEGTEMNKKMCEKLAERLGEICIETKPLVIGTIADEMHGCDKYISCKECFLDWARKEVEKDEC